MRLAASVGWPSAVHFLEPTVEHGDRVVSKPTQKPPQAAREHPVLLIVGHHLHAARDPEAAEGLRQRVRVRRRMSSVRPTLGTGQIVCEIRVAGARNVSSRVLPLAPREVVELRTAVDDREGRILHV